jgi:hypothetical protein
MLVPMPNRPVGAAGPAGSVTHPAPAGDGLPRQLLPRWAVVVFAGASVAIVPWVVVLAATLPSRVEAAHWRVIWVGFDLALVATLGGTAVRLVRRSARTLLVATAAGTLLVCDAWFDVLTADGTGERLVAVALAVLLELPLAGFCFWVAFTVESLFEQARPHLAAAGFTVEGRRLVPPERAVPGGGESA